jgi:hypothetical protein
MAKRSFGKGSIADLVREAEETQKAQEDLAIANASASEQEAEDVKEAEVSEQGQECIENNSAPPTLTVITPTSTPPQEQGGKTKPPAEAAPVEAVDKSVFFSAENILSKEHKYKNARQQVNISEDFYCFLKAVSKQSDITIAQIINNMLRPYFVDKELRKEIKSLAQKKFKEAVNRMDDVD